MTRKMQQGIVVAGAVALGLFVQGTASAQSLDPRWTAWTGCWQAEAPQGSAAAITAAGPTVCVVPASSGSAVEIVTVVDGKVAGRETLAATGARTPVSRESCSGFTTADWSADGRRIYRTAEYTCPGGFSRKSTGMIAMSPTGEWIDIEGLAAGTQEAVRVLRYRPLGSLEGVPAEVAAALEGRTFTTSTARMAAASEVGSAEVIEASRRVGPGVVEAWLAERGQGFALELDARRLLQLTEAGVSTGVIDMMVALSYPERFAVNQTSGLPRVRPGEPSESRGVDTFGRDPWSYGYGYPGYLGYGYGYGYGNGYGYDGYGYNRYGYGSYYNRPVIVVRDSERQEQSTSRGRMVNGRGYSGGNTGSTSEPSSRPSGDTGSSSSGSSGGSSSSGSSGSGSSGSSGGTRTAQPR